jgi:beta-1,4-mannosyltransferase
MSTPNGAVKLAAFPYSDRNPYNRLLYGALTESGIHAIPDPDLRVRWLWWHRRQVTFLHFHWDKFYYESRSRRPRYREARSWMKTLRYALLLLMARALGYRIIWTVHEVVPHEPRNRVRDLVAAGFLARISHALLAHDHATAERARRWLRIDEERLRIVPHGSYLGVYPPGRSREAVRDEWGLDAKSVVFLAFGNLRSYKRLELLLDAFKRVESPDVALVIAGEFLWRFREPEWERDMLARLQAAAKADQRIRFRLGRVPEDGVAELHGACDAAVMARSDGWTSGSMVLALSHGLPVIAARQPAYVALLGDGDAGWLYEPGSASALAAAMSEVARDRDAIAAKARGARSHAQTLDWRRIAASIAEVMMSTLNDRPS